MARDPIAGAAGYTVIELIIAMSLATFVVVGVMMVTGSATRFAVVGNTRADVAGWSLTGLHQLNTDIEGATYIKGGASLPSDKLSGCQNYSVNSGATIDSSAAVLSFYYCVATVNSVQSLLRYTGASCPISPTPTCGSGVFTVVAKNVHRKNEPLTTPDYFKISADAPNAVEMHFVVGVASSTATSGWTAASVPSGSGLYTPTPQAMMIDTTIRTNIVPGDTGDLQ